jgi:Zn-dependent metalloprotease
MKKSNVVAFVLVAALALPGFAARQDRTGAEDVVVTPGTMAAARGYLRSNANALGLVDADRELQTRSGHTDEVGLTHIRFDQFLDGVRVFEGEAIAHVDQLGRTTVTDSIQRSARVGTTPRLSEATAIGTAITELAPRGQYTTKSELVILPRGEHTNRTQLVWHVTVYIDNGVDQQSQWEYFVNAHDGAVALKYDALPTTAGTAVTMFSGTQPMDITLSGTTYSLVDPTRGTSGGNYTINLNNATSGGTTVTGTTAVFGTGVKTDSSGGVGLDRITAAAEAHWGLQRTWDYYKNTHGRTGIDGAGTRTYSRVHYSTAYSNASWSDSCFCMTYGDGGTTFYPVVALDVAGHEMSHGVMSREANLTYRGESGGLNESNSDIFGTLVEFDVNSAVDTPDWWIGERIYRSNWSTNGTYTQTKALRYMDDPSKDGASPSCYSKQLKSLDVHYSSGPNNHFFYLLANGGTSKCTGTTVTGIGRADAARIWYKAITDYMTASSGYPAARAAALNAAAALFGTGSTQYNAVAAAYAAIKVN